MEQYEEITFVEYETAIRDCEREAFTDRDIRKITDISHVFNISPFEDNFRIDICNDGREIRVYKIYDEYFYVWHYWNRCYTFYKCDQIEGLCSLINMLEDATI